MKKIHVGIVGTGLIAGVIARSILSSSHARLAAVVSRRQQTADAFVQAFPGAKAVEGLEPLLRLEEVDAVYVATPTSTKEAIVLAALAADKHVLVDKPFISAASVQRMIDAAASRELVLMDATHFVHHPRTQCLKDIIPAKVGGQRTLHAAFYTSLDDAVNIRFDTTAEPMGVLGDMGWYAMRALVEYLQPAGKPGNVALCGEKHPETGALIRATGLLGFDSGEHATFEVGFTSNTGVMDLRLTGSRGVVSMDDFPLDWTNSIAYQNEDLQTGYFYRSGRITRKDVAFVPTPSDLPADVLMIDRFSQLIKSGDGKAVAAYTGAMLKTQRFLDTVWKSGSENV